METSELNTSVEVLFFISRIIHNDIICILSNEDGQEYFEDNQQGLNVPQGNLVDIQAEGLRKRDYIVLHLPYVMHSTT